MTNGEIKYALAFPRIIRLEKTLQLLEEESPTYVDGSALTSSLGSPVINRASAQPLPRFGIFPVFPKSGKSERTSVFHGDRERQLRLSCFAPFVESIGRNPQLSFGKLVKQKRKARTGFNPKTRQKIRIPAKTVVKFRVAKAAKDAVLGVKK